MQLIKQTELCVGRSVLLSLKASVFLKKIAFLIIKYLGCSGIRTLNFFDGNSSDHESVFLLAVKEVPACGGIQNKEFGVCFVDTCVGTFHVSLIFVSLRLQSKHFSWVSLKMIASVPG